MSGYDMSNWLYQGDKAKDRPADLGYYIGYKICESFYRHAKDQREALRRILNIADAAEFLKESGYSGTTSISADRLEERTDEDLVCGRDEAPWIGEGTLIG